jgi:hypothetical protein
MLFSEPDDFSLYKWWRDFKGGGVAIRILLHSSGQEDSFFCPHHFRPCILVISLQKLAVLWERIINSASVGFFRPPRFSGTIEKI